LQIPAACDLVVTEYHMIAIMAPAPEWLRNELGKAILAVYDGCDQVLISRGSSERSIMFRIGRHLAPVIEDRHPGYLWVDLEYNRVASTKHEQTAEQVAELQVKKELEGLVRKTKRSSVFPDLIVHDRTGSSARYNLLVAVTG
jgi:hypothetical protein